ncbi:MAG: nucleoside hydrolase-like domain-containing protein [Bryobacteraceae bacterium]
MMKLYAAPLLLVCLASLVASAQQPAKPRLIILTDIGGDPDDQQSMVRLMTYSNEFDIEGLIASASGTPGELKRSIVQPQLIRQIVEAYGKVRPNLIRHAEGYPPIDRLLGIIKSGNPNRGVPSIGAEHDTEGSNWIISVVDRADPRPVNVAIWGGPTELAQALWRVRNDRSESGLKKFVSRLRVHAIGHQDDSGPWILENFPGLFYILSAADPLDVSGRPQKGIDRRASVYRGMYLGGDESLTSKEWIDTHVRNGHGPLGALYPPKTWTAPNPHSALKEGDTPSWFYFLQAGLSDSAHPEWGGWGGRFRLVKNRYYNDAKDTFDGTTDARSTVSRWRKAFQNDFQARMDWCASARRNDANHNPIAVLNGDKSKRIVRLTVKPGAQVRLSAAGSQDPDGHKLRYRWFVYPEAGDWDGRLDLEGADSQVASFEAPSLSEPRTLHIILEIVDDGTPSLFSYRRAVVRVEP